jgi:hypothetical protein
MRIFTCRSTFLYGDIAIGGRDGTWNRKKGCFKLRDKGARKASKMLLRRAGAVKRKKENSESSEQNIYVIVETLPTKFQGIVQGQGPFRVDFNTGNNYGVVVRNFGEKKCFRPKL